MSSRAFAFLLIVTLNGCGIDFTPNRPSGPGQTVDLGGGGPWSSRIMLVETTPLTVINDRDIGGTFSIRDARRGEKGIIGATNGGACIIARITPVSGTCMRDSDCSRRFPYLKASDGYAYCIKQGQVTGTCFVKPNEGYCRKRIGPGSYHPISVNTTQVREFAARQRGPTTIDWMIIACLNGPDVRDLGGQWAKPCALRARPVPGMINMYAESPVMRFP